MLIELGGMQLLYVYDFRPNITSSGSVTIIDLTKIRLFSQANQNHLWRDLFSFSVC